MSSQLFHYLFLSFLIGLIGLMFFLLAWYFYKEESDFKKIIKNQAIKRNGQVSGGLFFGKPTLRFNHYNEPVKIYNLRTRYSCITYIEIYLSQRVDQTIKIYKESIASKIGKTLGMRDIQIDNPDFDEKIIIKASDERFIRKILTFEIQNKILSLMEKYSFTISLNNNLFIITFNNYFKNDFDCDEFINLSLKLVDKIKIPEKF